MPGELILTHGMPGSGKSTEMEKLVKSDPETYVRVNRDDIRTHLFGAKYHDSPPVQKSEQQVNVLQESLMKKGFAANKKVISDDTNLNTRFVRKLVGLARNYDAKVSQHHFNVPVETCKQRNRKRRDEGGRFVPEDVMDAIASRAYSEDGNLKEFVIGSDGNVFAIDLHTPGGLLIDSFNKKLEYANPLVDKSVVFVDVDGTLANNSHDSAYAFRREGEKKDFGYFYSSIENAPVNVQVRDLANLMRENDGLNIFIMTGRTDDYAKELLSFIKRSGIKASRVIAKRENDGRKDSDFKEEQIGKLRKEGFVIVHSIDDRERSVRAYEAAGIMVSRVQFFEEPYDPSNSGPIEEPSVNTVYGSGYCIRCGQPLKNGGNIGPVCRNSPKI